MPPVFRANISDVLRVYYAIRCYHHLHRDERKSCFHEIQKFFAARVRPISMVANAMVVELQIDEFEGIVYPRWCLFSGLTVVEMIAQVVKPKPIELLHRFFPPKPASPVSRQYIKVGSQVVQKIGANTPSSSPIYVFCIARSSPTQRTSKQLAERCETQRQEMEKRSNASREETGLEGHFLFYYLLTE